MGGKRALRGWHEAEFVMHAPGILGDIRDLAQRHLGLGCVFSSSEKSRSHGYNVDQQLNKRTVEDTFADDRYLCFAKYCITVADLCVHKWFGVIGGLRFPTSERFV